MTQLPEVEVVRKDLEKEIVGKRFKQITVKAAATVGRHRNRPEFAAAVEGRRVKAVNRKGTSLLIELDDAATLVVRLGPEGVLTRETASQEPSRHTQMVATFTTGGALHLVDPHKHAELFVVGPDGLGTVPELAAGGIDPLADTFTWHAFASELTTRQTRLKRLLLDESFIVGLGDLYSDEILWAAGLSGERVSSSLSSQEVRRLYRAVFEVLYEAVKQRGTSGSGPGPAEHVDLFGEPGEYGHYLKVYDREGLPCPRCRRPIARTMLDDDLVTFSCTACQT